MPAEVTNIVRRSLMNGLITSDVASLALADLSAIRVELFAFDPFASRVWELRDNVTSYDAWYVALAEAMLAPLATLDDRLSRAVGPRCEFVVRPSAR
jgi:predicted nucleic acid-binding protein